MQIPMRSKLNKGLNGTLNDLATYVETGKPSAAKQRELAKKKRR